MRLENLKEKCVLIMQKPPGLLSKKRIIEKSQILKSHTSNHLRFSHFIPFKPMNFSFISMLSPPKFYDQNLKLVTQTQLMGV